MKRRQAGHSKEKGAQLMRLRTADIYGGMIPSRLREDETLPALAQSIARHGLLQPIVVQENPANGRYMLVCGARRLAACRMLGLEEIDAVNIPGDKPEAVACFLEEHFTRKGVSFLEEARLLSRDGVAQKCCMPEGEMRRRLSMLELDAQTQAVIERGGLSMEQAEWLKGVQPKARRLEAAEGAHTRTVRLTGRKAQVAEDGKSCQFTFDVDLYYREEPQTTGEGMEYLKQEETWKRQ